VQRIRIFSAGKIDNQFAAECLFVWAIDVNCVNCTKANNDLSTMKTNQKVKNDQARSRTKVVAEGYSLVGCLYSFQGRFCVQSSTRQKNQMEFALTDRKALWSWILLCTRYASPYPDKPSH
jgi:hypothetical protein